MVFISKYSVMNLIISSKKRNTIKQLSSNNYLQYLIVTLLQSNNRTFTHIVPSIQQSNRNIKNILLEILS